MAIRPKIRLPAGASAGLLDFVAMLSADGPGRQIPGIVPWYLAQKLSRLSMQDGDRKPLDEKTALLIEQTEDSLRKMEKTLGPDHPVVGKILDTYARLLRQNNYRVLDAINMEARAKAIRAKHNQVEAEAQAKAFDEDPVLTAQSRPKVSANTLKLMFWLLALVLAGGITVSGMRTMHKVGKIEGKKHHHEKQQVASPVGEGASAESGENSASANQSSSASPPDEEASSAERRESTAHSSLQRPSNVERSEPNAEQSAPKEWEGVRSEVTQLVAHGQEYEQSGNTADAEESYKTAIIAAQQVSTPNRMFVSEDLARAFDYLANLLEAKGNNEGAANMRNNAKGVRQLLEQSFQK